MDLQELAHNILKRSKYESEVYITRNRHLSIDILDQNIESVHNGDTLGIALRVINGGKIGFAYSSSLDIDTLIKSAVTNLQFCPEDDSYCLASKIKEYELLDLYDDEINKISFEEKLRTARSIESSAYETDKKITKTDSGGYSEEEEEVAVANSNGIIGTYKTNCCGGFISCIAEYSGDSEEGMDMRVLKKWKELDPKNVGYKAAKNAVELLGGTLIDSAKIPVVLSPMVGAEFLSYISIMFCADNVQKGKSPFKNMLGKNILSPLVTIIDDATLAGGISTAPFDGEGTYSRKNILIETGTLKSFMHNCYTAKKDGTSSTGNAVRMSFKSPPVTGKTNFYLENGKRSPEDIIRSIQKGILITKVMAMHSINPISGDFSVGASGIMIENGQKTFPVRSVTIAGNLLEMLKKVQDKGNNLEFFPQAENCGCPTLLIESLDIGGK